ncbi:hypothetical protein [Streptomyces sp. NPDC021012]|uniref:hypothetical protein n=1 Tax=unclassified Streptomyces TaxID=2593676 RepID=UPI0037B278F1
MAMVAGRGEGRDAVRWEGPARSVRDLVLVVGLAGVVVGGVALLFKTSRSTGSHLPVVLVVLVLLLGVGAAVTR